MAQSNKICEICGELGHSKFYCKKKPYKPIAKKSTKVKLVKDKPKQLSRSKIKKQLDKLVKDYVKERDDYTCQHCGKKVDGSNCHASHILPVGSHSKMEFEPYNIKVLCYHCHINFWHKDPNAAVEWFNLEFPDRYDKLLEMESIKPKLSTAELQELVDLYKLRIKIAK